MEERRKQLRKRDRKHLTCSGPASHLVRGHKANKLRIKTRELVGSRALLGEKE